VTGEDVVRRAGVVEVADEGDPPAVAGTLEQCGVRVRQHRRVHDVSHVGARELHGRFERRAPDARERAAKAFARRQLDVVEHALLRQLVAHRMQRAGELG